MLHAYFDETGGDEASELTAVAGYVFDGEGVERFGKSWKPMVAGLSKPYRSARCNAGEAPFDLPSWPESRRHELMDRLALLSAETARAGFVVATTRVEFQNALENGPAVRRLIDSPYTLCVLSLLSQIGIWADQADEIIGVHCWFEKGGHNWKSAQRFVERLRSNSSITGFAKIAECVWVPKMEAPAFCAADLLAWEWRQNVLRSQDHWTQRMDMLLSRMRDNSSPLYADHMTAVGASLWAMQSALGRLHRDG